MDEEEITNIWSIITTYYEEYLKEDGVKLPKLKENNLYTKNALTLIYLAKGYPNTELVTKEALTSFIRTYYPNVVDVQQARHLAMQSGWYIASGTRGDKQDNVENIDNTDGEPFTNIPYGSYKLITLCTPYPAFIKERREGFTGDWQEIKKEYGYRFFSYG